MHYSGNKPCEKFIAGFIEEHSIFFTANETPVCPIYSIAVFQLTHIPAGIDIFHALDFFLVICIIITFDVPNFKPYALYRLSLPLNILAGESK